jgi:hypothetical protein
MAEDPRQRAADGAVDHAQVGVAHPRRKHPHNLLSAVRRKILPIFEHQGLTGRMQPSGPHEDSTYPD